MQSVNRLLIELHFTLYILLIAALLGAAMGSFINCAAARYVQGESALKGRSHCPVCSHTLHALDLVPIFSYLFLRGRCRYCGAAISKRCLYTELLGALILLSMLLSYSLSLEAAAYAVLLYILLAIALIDLDTGLVPDRLIVTGIGFFLFFALLSPNRLGYLWQGILGGIATALPLLLLVLLADKLMKKETMGGGDIKLFFMAGLYLGWKLGILLLIFSCLFGIFFAVIAKKKRGMEFPFAPSIFAGVWVCALWGLPLLNAYIGLF